MGVVGAARADSTRALPGWRRNSEAIEPQIRINLTYLHHVPAGSSCQCRVVEIRSRPDIRLGRGDIGLFE
jgi:hypothetical protein